MMNFQKSSKRPLTPPHFRKIMFANFPWKSSVKIPVLRSKICNTSFWIENYPNAPSTPPPPWNFFRKFTCFGSVTCPYARSCVVATIQELITGPSLSSVGLYFTFILNLDGWLHQKARATCCCDLLMWQSNFYQAFQGRIHFDVGWLPVIMSTDSFFTKNTTSI